MTLKADNFTTTNWSVVLQAGQTDYGRAAAALERLCRKYWYPIYAFIRRRGSDGHEAEDLTQAFFAHLLEKETLKKVNRQKGKFRSFLLVAVTNFLANEWDKRQALKRGGQNQIISLDEMAAEELYSHEPAATLTPEKLFERRWALTLVELLLFLAATVVAHAQSYSINWYKISGGGGTSTGATYQVTGTIGQPDASGAMSGGNFSVTGGFWSLISVVQTPGAPTLTITHSGNTVKISWPYPSTGWTLQQNSDLSKASWSTSSGISNDGTNNFITIISPAGNLFCRLQKL